jgi:hypothetical protein
MDAPTQGHPVTRAQLSSDIDKQLDALEQLPPEKRGMARFKLDKPIAAKGTATQRARYAQLMAGAPPPPIGMAHLRPAQAPGSTTAKLLLPSQSGP